MKRHIEALLAGADIQINGSRPWDMRVTDERLYGRILGQGTLGLGEAYMDGWWDAEAIDELVCRFLRSNQATPRSNSLKTLLQRVASGVMNFQSLSRAPINAQHHYDIGNDLYQAMLGKRMVYTSAFWDQAMNLDEAQEAKLDLVCRKLNLKPGQRVLDIGCGWGSFVKFAAERYDVECVGITLSKDQYELGNSICRGLPVEIRLQDYREIRGTFDHVVSLGMIEHVGDKNYRQYMDSVWRVLADRGLFLLQTIGSNLSTHRIEPWLDKYIFPNAVLPSITQLGRAIEGLFVMEDWHNFGVHYDKTLMAWFANFDQEWATLKVRYSGRFYRMWKFYLLSCAGAFRARHVHVWQILLSKGGMDQGFRR